MKSLLQGALEALIAEGALYGDLSAYSGRGMYGSECLAFAPSEAVNPLELGVKLALAVANKVHAEGGHTPDLLVELAGEAERFRQDSLGKGVIYYWPQVPYVKDPE